MDGTERKVARPTRKMHPLVNEKATTSGKIQPVIANKIKKAFQMRYGQALGGFSADKEE